ncbi:MAG: hypothetical protein J6Y53_03285 [Alphaproteobacteria bacterium]|nr:hypothetical protein [Alphaproteobacteria bacterium]
MKLLLSLLGILGIVYGVAWFAYDIHPKDLTYRMIGSVSNFGSSTQEKSSNVVDAASRFSEVIQNRYHSQDMTEPHPN